MSAPCQTCNRRFPNYTAAIQHMVAKSHWKIHECETCNFSSIYEDEVEDHMSEYGHWGPTFECEACSAMFYTPQQARQHMEINNHFRTHWCAPCKRGFQNENNLRMHLNGHAHRANSVPCPFCKRLFTAASGVTHHLETGSCPGAPKLNRETIYRSIRHYDTTGFITNQQLGWHDDHQNDCIATSAAFNGNYWECYICHREFFTLASLNLHLASDAHKQKIYHCPGRLCQKQFINLAGLVQHLVGESCGAVRFSTMQQTYDGFLTGRRIAALQISC